MNDEREITVTIGGVSYTATVGLVSNGDYNNYRPALDDRGIYWNSRNIDLTNIADEEYNQICDEICKKYIEVVNGSNQNQKGR